MPQLLPQPPAWLRRLGRRPAFLTLAVLTLGVGIGATTAMFTVVDAVLLRPLPYPEPERLVRLWSHAELPGRDDGSPLSVNEAVEYAERARAFTGIAALGWGPATLLGGGEPRQVTAARVSHSFFPVIGVSPRLGRGFTAREDVPGHDRVVVLSHGLWAEAFGADPAIVGRKVVLDGRPLVVIGVMPAGFAFPRRAALWVPLAIDRAALDAESITSHGLNAVARLRAGVTRAAAEADLDRVVRQLAEVYPDHFDARDAVLVVELERALTGGVRTPLLALLAAVGFLLALSCANVANLLLLRAEERRREVAVRRALGASTVRLARLLLGEGLALSTAAAAVAVVGTSWGLAGLRALLPPDLPRAEELAVDWRVLGFTVVLAAGTTMLVSLAPAWRFRRAGGAAALRGRSAAAGSGRLADGLVVGQLALALALSSGAALAGRSLQRLAAIESGFAADRVLTARIALPEGAGYQPEQEVRAFFETLARRLAAADPRVEAVGAASWLPFADYPSDWPVEVEGAPPRAPSDGPDTADYTLIGGDYLAAVGAPLRAGRYLRPGDASGRRKAVVTEGFVRRYLRGRDAVGRTLRLALDPAPYEIVGVVADQRLRGPAASPRPGIYLPHVELQTGNSFLPRAMAVVVRTRGVPEALAGPLRRVVRELDPQLPVSEIRSFADLRREALGEPRSLAALLGLFAAAGLVLGGVGSYAVAAARVAQQRRDIGVRLALGARWGQVAAAVLGRGLRLTLLGCALGGLVAWLAARAVGERLLFAVAPGDPLALGAAAALLLLVAAAAHLMPAWRASAVDPMQVLREE